MILRFRSFLLFRVLPLLPTLAPCRLSYRQLLQPDS